MSKVLIQGDWLDGFSSGRKAALLDWRFRKEAREGIAGAPSFAILVNRLRSRKWSKENPERRNATNARHQRTEPAKVKRRAAKRRRHLVAYRANPTVHACLRCGATWCKVPWVRGVPPRFCGQACRKSWRWHHDEAYRARVQETRRDRRAA